MKKILISALLSIGLISCDNYLDVNKDPNNPTKVENKLLIPSAQGFIAATVGGTMHNLGAFFAQYCDQMPEAQQYDELSTYGFNSDVFNRDYLNLYSGALQDLEVIRKQATDNGNTADYFLATVLRAYSFQILADYLGDAPYSEALQGAAVPMPKWDSGADIYAGILKELDEAEKNIATGAAISGGDLIFDGNLNKWIQFANALRLRIYMRTSNVNNNAEVIKALIQKDNFFSGDVKFSALADENNKRNPWFQTNAISLAKNHVGSYPIISYLRATNDPRISDLFVVAKKSGDYVGMLPGSRANLINTNKNDAYSSLVYNISVQGDPQSKLNAERPVFLYTQSELQFFLAEAYLRFFNDDTKAKASYESAIDANFYITRNIDPAILASNIYGTGKMASWAGATTQEEKLKLIGIQKWVALCMVNNAEAWSEVRRMGYPKLSTKTAAEISTNPTVYNVGELIAPWTNSLGEGKLVKRVFYPQTAVNLNKNTPTQKELTIPVWWEKK